VSDALGLLDITSTLGRFFRAVDAQDWGVVTTALAETVTTDYTSVFGGVPEQLSREELVTRWRGLLPGFDATQHLVGPPVVLGTPDGAWVRVGCNVRGYHHLESRTWMVAGWYTVALDGDAAASGSWRIAGIALAMSYETGDRGLVARAQQRSPG
jgi:hypothetical protein